MKIYPYLAFSGQAEEALNFYAKILHGKLHLTHYGDMPQMPVDDKYKKWLANGQLSSDDFMLMASDMIPEYGKLLNGSDITIAITVKTAEEGKIIFDALAQGGKIGMPYNKALWAEGYGMLTDKFNVGWQISGNMLM
jgi:PhnB protein